MFLKIRYVLGVLGCLTLFACASSNVTRDVSAGVDMGVQNAKNLANQATSGDMSNTYQNANQATKGGAIGATAGAVTGVMSSSVGFLPGTAAGLILGASYGSYIDANTTLADQLENRGLNVILLGDHILIVIPSARIFDPMTAHINPSAYSTLNLVSQYINHFTTMLVKVSVYTNRLGSKQANQALSEEQAKSVEQFFVRNGLDARLLYAAGYGGTHLVDTNSKVWDGSDNYRIEITLEKIDE